MLDVLDTAVFDPFAKRAVFCRGERYVEWAHREGVVANGVLRDRWPGLPEELHAGIDAAVFIDGALYLFRGPWFAVWTRTGTSTLKRIGFDGFKHLPEAFHAGVDGAYRDAARGETLLFRGSSHVVCETGVIVEGDPVGTLLDYPPNGRVYAFRGREYSYWDPKTRAIMPGPPRRIGAPYGRGLPRERGGGWFGLSHVVAGSMVVEEGIWLWLIDRGAVDRVRLRVDGHVRVPDVRVIDAPVIEPGVVAVFTLSSLAPACTYEIEVLVGEVVVDRVSLRTPQPPAATGRVELVVGSCADTSALRDVPAYEAMAARVAHAALLLGDNCYYINALGSSSDSFWKGGWFRADWDDPVRMLLRQLAARNHPQLARLARTTRMHATWDDHDFGYNNATGHDRTRWAGRDTSAAIHRALWGAPYVDAHAIYYAFREGPVEVFVTDSRYDASRKTRTVLGEAQLAWLRASLVASDAPVKLVALSSQFLYRDKSESFLTDAPREREQLLELFGSVSGRIAILSGDVHYHELARWPAGEGEATIVEFTASGLRTGETGETFTEWQPGARVWAVQADGFGVVTVDVAGEGTGTITFEVRDAAGELLRTATWDLATGLLR